MHSLWWIRADYILAISALAGVAIIGVVMAVVVRCGKGNVK